MKPVEQKKTTPKDLINEVPWDKLDSVLVIGRGKDGGISLQGAGLSGGEGVYLSQFVAQYLISREVKSATEKR